ncbi:MAG: PIN domain-containing protein [Treponema sp.]|nr:PIN domain-containing protein [Treponema sp.]
MRILIDSNVALDVLLRRGAFYAPALRVFGLARGGYGIFVSASAITDIYYIIRKLTKNKEFALASVKNLLAMIDVAAVSGNEIRLAANLDWGDFEDAVQYAVGESLEADYIVTRNKADFASATLPVVSPDELLAILVPPVT